MASTILSLLEYRLIRVPELNFYPISGLLI